ncbi:ATP-binding protein, partial [Verrucomicrobia bacterium]|nr:ATP-binding protein [Verrucomicrobiota bacterium]
MIDKMEIKPDPARLISALSHIGYKLEDSISDLVDNSISAHAKNVLIRFLHDGENITQILVADDGVGMRPSVLKESMRFGSAEASDISSLGKYGLGLKLASLAYCNDLRVTSKVDRSYSGLSWSVEGISSGWQCERLGKQICSNLLRQEFGPISFAESGTVVQWCDLKNLPTHKKGLRSLLGGIEKRLRLHIGTRFHRFIQGERVSIHMDQQLSHGEPEDYWVTIQPLDPFGYEKSGNEEFPSKFRSPPIGGVGNIEFEAHIWPPKSESENYRLGKRTSSSQGFFVYRNDRLIQAGGWLGLVNDETEAHSSLARIKMDLPPGLEDLFSLNVQKSSVI